MGTRRWIAGCVGAMAWNHAGANCQPPVPFDPPLYRNLHNFHPADGASNSETFFGYRVDIADTKMVIGDPYFRDPANQLVGGFSVFEYNPNLGQWTLEQHIAAGEDYRGCSYQDISTDGSRVATIANPAASPSDRHVLIHAYGAAGWELEDTLIPPTRPSSLNIEGDALLVGAWTTTHGVGYVYRRQADGHWALETTLMGAPPFDAPLGVDCDLHGDLAILSAYAEYPVGYGAAVYRFDHALGAWQLEQTIQPTPQYPSLGWSASTDGWRIVLGSRAIGGGASVFRYDPSLPGPPWHHEATLAVPAGGSRVIPDDVSVEGCLLFVSDRWGGVGRRGRVYSYRYDAGLWNLEHALGRPGGEQDLDQFGGSFGRHGATLVVGCFVYGERAQASVFVRTSEAPAPTLPDPPICPVIIRQPSGLAAVQGREYTIDVSAYAAGTLAYQWQRDGVNLVDGPAPGGGEIRGAATPLLSVAPIAPADAGHYRVRITNACATLSSVARYIRVLCPADFNRDAEIGSADFFAFLAALFAESPAADFNSSGALDSQDFFDFIAAFFAPC